MRFPANATWLQRFWPGHLRLVSIAAMELSPR
jgi:hypothetical protein